MSDTDIKDMEKALDAILSMADKGKKAQVKFRRGTSQYTLLENRINALNIAFSLINKELGNDMSQEFERAALENACAPIQSLISKSEKAQTRLKPGTWQYVMLENNIKALYIAWPLVLKELDR
ncbi:hypothetical protein [Murimonas intestini]|uniref:hypothetical protein n=1 Tax=Murimonas intestini TaxID=1337051 RepID=UPI0011DC847F|nr:hypothetical protein [Murimonas intestini]